MMRSTKPLSRRGLHRLFWPILTTVLVLMVLLAWRATTPPISQSPPDGRTDDSQPWQLGTATARFTIVLYSDLTCPHCQAYVPGLIAWIERQSDFRLHWQHFLLPEHEPATTQLAILAECAGEAGGHTGFWRMVGKIYAHDVLKDMSPTDPDASSDCMKQERHLALIQRQAAEALIDGIKGTPTLRLRDEWTGRSLLLPGPVSGDALLSAIDLLDAGERAVELPHAEALSADSDGETPR